MRPLINLLLLLVFCLKTAAALAQTVVSAPAGTVTTSPQTDSRAVGWAGGKTWTYSNTSWPAFSSPCFVYGFPDVINGVINGYVTAPPTNGACTGTANLTYDGVNSNLAGGILYYTGTTNYRYNNTSWVYTTTAQAVKMTIKFTANPSNAAIPVTSSNGYKFIKVTQNFNVNVEVDVLSPTNAVYNPATTANAYIPAITLFDNLYTDPNSSICTSVSAGSFLNFTVSPTATNTSPSCSGVNVTLNSSATAQATGAVTYTNWKNPANTVIATNTQNTTLTAPTTASSGTYTVTVTDAIGCVATATTNVVVNPLPTVYTVTGGGTYCTGGAGVTVGLSNSTVGVNYQLQVGGVNTGAPIAGTNAAISFTNQTTVGNYTIIATNATTLCTAAMSGSVAVSVNPLPTAYAVTGGGAFCSGGTGVAVGLANSTVGVNYQLQLNGSNIGAPIAGAGGAISFGNQTVGGSYSVIATNTTTLCSASMSGSVMVVVNPLPTPYAVTGGGAYCSGGAGVAVGLANSTTGISYQLQIGGVNTGGPITGTSGSPINFGNQVAAGTYTVVATNPSTTCSGSMTGSVAVAIDPLPFTFNVTGGGAYCSGGTGVAVGLSSSTPGVNYQLQLGGVNIGSIVGGTGAAISFGNQISAGTYTVVATNATTSCTANMIGSVNVSIDPAPTAYAVTGGGNYCNGGTGFPVGLANSTLGISYQLKLNGSNSGFALTGTGFGFSFGNQAVPGLYTVVATDFGTGCSATMTGNAVIGIIPRPTAAITGTSTTICNGTSGTISGTITASGPWTMTLNNGGGTVTGNGSGNWTQSVSPSTNTTYALVSLVDANCTAIAGDLTGAYTVNVNTPATANAGLDATVCGTLANLSATASGTGTWSAATGAFGTATNAATTYTATAATGQTLSLTWTTNDPDGAGPCPAVSDVVDITFNTPASANAGLDATVCGTLANLSATANGTGTWSAASGAFGTATNAATAYTATAATGQTLSLTWTTDDPDGAGPCVAASDVVDITFNAPATADAGLDAAFCGTLANIAATANGTGTWSAATGTFGTATNLATTYTVAAATGQTISLTWTTDDPDGAGPCAAVSDVVDITFNTPASADAGLDATVCGTLVNVSATANGTGTWSAASGAFGTATNAATAYTATAATGQTLSLTWTTDDPDGAGPCVAVSDIVDITFNEPAIANAGADATFCGNVANLSATTNGTGTWSAASGVWGTATNANTTYTVTAATGQTVSLTWTTNDPDGTGPCTAVSDMMDATFNTISTANAGLDATVCGTVANLSAIASGTGTWSAATGNFGVAANASTTYTVAAATGQTVSLTWTTDDPDGAGPCVAVSDVVDVTFNAPATADAGLDATVCGTIANISATANGTGTWSAATGAFGTATNTATAYTATAASNQTLSLTWTTDDPDGTGPCAAVSDVVDITFNTPATADAGLDATFCGTLANISATTNGTGTWSAATGAFGTATNAATAYTATAATGQSVSLTWTTDDPDGAGPCVAASDVVDITFNTPATADAGLDATVCGTAVNVSATASGTGTWSAATGSFGTATNTATAYTATAASNQTLSLTWTTDDPDGTGPCAAVSDVVDITFNTPASANAGLDATVCGTLANISATTNGTGTWSAATGAFGTATNAATAYTATAATGQTVSLTWTTDDPDGAGPCVAASDVVDITFNTPATADAGLDATVCGTAVNVSATANGTGTWSAATGAFGTATNTATAYTATAASNQILSLTWTTDDPDGTGPCAAVSDVVDITFNTPATADAGLDATFCGTLANISATTNGTGTWSAATGAFGTATNAATSYTATAATGQTVSLTWTTDDPDGAGPCVAVSDVVDITFNTPATADAGLDATVCGTIANISATASGAGTWSAVSGSFGAATNTATAYTATAASNQILSLTWTTDDPDGTGPCAAVSDVVDITFNTPASANAGLDATVCGTLANISATTNGTGTWSAATGAFGTATNAATSYTATAATGQSVSLTWTTDDPDGAGPCLAVSDVVDVTFNAPATADAGFDATVCGTTVNISATASGTGTWSAVSGSFGAASNTATTYTATAATGQTESLTWTTDDPDGTGPCTAVSDAVAVTFSTPTSADAGPNQTTCALTPVALAATGIGTWSGGLGTFAANNNPTTTYTPDASEIGTTVTLTWTVAGIAPCLNATDNVDVMVTPFSTTVPPTNGGTWSANFEYTDAAGWTHYYDNNGTPNNYCDDLLLLSLKKNGNNIGTTGVGGFTVQVKGVGGAVHVNPDVTAPINYVTSADWWVLSRYWEVTPTTQPSSDINVKFYYKTADYASINSALPTPLGAHADLKFFKINNPTVGIYDANPTNGHLDIPPAAVYSDAGYWQYDNGATASTSNWAYSLLPSGDHSAEYVIAKFSGGGGGGGTQDGAFPIELLSFNGFNAGQTNILNWTTASEIRFDRFVLTRSADNTVFEPIGTIAHKGQNGQGAGYSFMDNHPINGLNFYRLDIIDIDGAVSHSQTIQLIMSGSTQFTVYPNPANDNVSVMTNGIDANAEITISNTLGQILIREDMSPKSGNVKTTNIERLAKGVYFYQVLYKGKSYVTKLIKE